MDWNEYFISIAEAARQKSKDPSSKIGAVLVGKDHEILTTGYNGFPRGIDETDQTRWERPIKYAYVCHAERNCIDNCARNGIRTKGSTLYLLGFGPPTVPCVECTKTIIQAGIKEVCGKAYKPADESWIKDLKFSHNLLIEAGIKFFEL